MARARPADAREPEPPAGELAALLKEVRSIEVQSSRLVSGVLAGGYSSVFRGSGIEFDEIREYVPGDDPRSVDWNVTARVGRPFVKEFVEEREHTLVFLLDLSASMDAGFGVWSPRRMAARIAACLALSAVENDDKVGLIAFGAGVERFVPPRKGARHALRIVRDCLALQVTTPTTALAPAVEYASRALRRHAVVFVMSDFLGFGDPAGAWQRNLALCAHRHDVIAVRILSPELDVDALAEVGPVRLRDPETGAPLLADFRSVRVRQAWRERTAAWRARVTADLRAAKIDVMDVPIPRAPDREAVLRPILEFFRMRQRRGQKR
ncbi:MAG: DUF58 domain-containing protein [Planctomycetes bacterium]|nr:DUF58 domain-containing protein [Planctomycetota bacterium]